MSRTKPLYVVPTIPEWIPDKLGDRYITIRGVHFLPFGHHKIWMRLYHEGIERPTRNYWLNLLKDMDMSWVILINDGDSVLQEKDGKSPVRALLDIGVIPIIRGRIKFPGHFNDMDAVKETVQIYAEYGLRAPWVVANEPLDDREWDTDVPPYDKAMGIVADRWKRAAQDIISCGGVVGFPDGPTYSKNPFDLIKEYATAFKYGDAFYASHHYGKGRKKDYPYDTITQTGFEHYNDETGEGIAFNEDIYSEYLDDYASDQQWREEPVWMINDARFRLAKEDTSAVKDPTCYRGWEQIVSYSRETFGFDVPMALTEGGWVPRDRAGSGPNTDIRLPHTTPNKVASRTLAMFDGNSPFFAICPWLIADDAMQMHGYTGWPFDAWVGWAYSEKYGYEKPVIDTLKKRGAMPIRKWASLQCSNVNQ